MAPCCGCGHNGDIRLERYMAQREFEHQALAVDTLAQSRSHLLVHLNRAPNHTFSHSVNVVVEHATCKKHETGR